MEACLAYDSIHGLQKMGDSQPMQTLTTLRQLKILHTKTVDAPAPCPAQMVIFTYHITQKRPSNVLQTQMIGSRQGSLNSLSELIRVEEVFGSFTLLQFKVLHEKTLLK